MRKPIDWALVQGYYDEGHDAAQCRERFRIRYGAWYQATRRGKLRVTRSAPPSQPRYDWSAVQAYYDAGNSLRVCRQHFGFCIASWHKAVKRGRISPRPLAKPLADLLANSKARTNIKKRLMQAGLLENRCLECGLSEWLGERLVIQIDHVNGVRDDYRLENLRMLCPNCHSQADTYGRRKARPGPLQEEPASV
jgi:5-methylcytosine-specific restriction endonuclease McrA